MPMRPLALLCAALILTVPVSASADFWSELRDSILSPGKNQSALSEADITAGLREALAQGTRKAISDLGHTDGYWAAPRFRVPLPPTVNKVETLLRNVGQGARVDAFHLSLNRAAEQAVPVAAEVFGDAVRQLTLKDVRNILNGPDNAATEYFRRTAGSALAVRFQPLVAQATDRVGVTREYKRMLSSAGPLASALGANPDLDGFVTQKALDGLFLRVAEEEKKIRENPAARGSEILQRVFGKR